MSDLARRAVACPRWRWMPGMRDNQGRRISSIGVYPTGIPDGDSRVRPNNSVSRQPILPDLSDPATVGCLLALYEETLTTRTCPDAVYMTISLFGLTSDEAVEALVKALEAAP